jgi:hypothetical protein
MPVGYKLRFPAFEKAQFVTALGINAHRLLSIIPSASSQAAA